jgi:UrcA family protein
MIRISMIAVAALAIAAAAAPASAQDIRVKVAGKDAATLHHDLWQAARKACDAELAGSILAYEVQQPCIRHAVKSAEEKIANAKLAANTAMVASAQ